MVTVKTNLIFIGNPGIGKSSILNALAKKELFNSGFSFKAVTQIFQRVIIGNVSFVDTLGLDEPKKIEAAASEIQKALKLGGIYRIFFVISLEGGILRNTDIMMIKIILKSLRNVQNLNFGIVVNKIDPDSMEHLKDLDVYNFFGVLKRHIEQDYDKFNVKQLFFLEHFYKNDWLSKFIPLPNDFLSYIENFEGTKILPEDVEKIDVSDEEIKKINEKIFKNQ